MITKTKTATLTLVISACTLIIVALVIVSHRLYWDRYLRAYTFESFVEHPFPTIDRLYPQERVAGQQSPRPLDEATERERSINADALNAAAAFASQSDSTSLIVLHDGVIQWQQYWLGARADTPVYSFSMHKSVVALLVGIAVTEGLIASIDEPLASYLTEWAAPDERHSITIRQALQMNSGLEPMSFPRNPFSKHARRQIGTDIASVALSFGLRDEPGKVFNYNGVNPTLLVMLLERATGMRYAEYLSEKLWKPLGNRNAAVWLDRDDGLARGATGLFATPMDWVRIGEMLLNGGTVDDRDIVSADWIRQMTTPSPTNPLYGLFIWLGTETPDERVLKPFKDFSATLAEPYKADDIVFFDGLGGQRVYVVPSRSLVIVRTGVLNSRWEDGRLPNLLIGGL